MPTQFYLASQTNKTGERRILISVHIKGVRALTSIGYSISPENWNEDKGQVKKGAKNSKGIDYLAINSRIHDLTSKFESLSTRGLPDKRRNSDAGSKHYWPRLIQ